MATLQEELEKNGFKGTEKVHHEAKDAIPPLDPRDGEVCKDFKETVRDLSKPFYHHPPRQSFSYRGRSGRVRTLEVKKIMSRVNKSSLGYRVLKVVCDYGSQGTPLSCDDVIAILSPAVPNINRDSVMGFLSKFAQVGGINKVLVGKNGKTPVYSADQDTDIDFVYAKYTESKNKIQRESISRKRKQKKSDWKQVPSPSRSTQGTEPDFLDFFLRVIMRDISAAINDAIIKIGAWLKDPSAFGRQS